MIRCNRCHKLKPAKFFYKGRRICKDCVGAKRKQWRLAHPGWNQAASERFYYAVTKPRRQQLARDRAAAKLRDTERLTLAERGQEAERLAREAL